MERRLLAGLTALLIAAPVSAEFRWAASLDVALVDVGPAPSFADHSQGKLRYGKDDGALQVLGGYLQIESDLDAVWTSKIALNLNDGAGEEVGLIDAYIQYRPLPVGGIRWRAKVGAFRPPISFEHGGDGWATLYTTNASAINSWVGEEIGHAGLEVTARRDLASNRGDWYWALSGAVFYGNDVAGTALSWRGWSLNNWQTPMGGEVPLANTPFIQGLPDQVPASEPFLELDDKPGYYAWGEVGISKRVRVRALYWKNRADPAASGRGQVGWCTHFTSIGLQASLPSGFGLLAQHMEGQTYAGPVIWGGRMAIDNPFDSQYVMLTRKADKHRFSLRHDWFGVDDRDFNPFDPNDEDGAAWTASYQYAFDDNWTFGLEYLRIDSERRNRVAEGLPVSLVEDTLMLVARWRR